MASAQRPGRAFDPRVFAPDDFVGPLTGDATTDEYVNLPDDNGITIEDAEDGGAFVGLPDNNPERADVNSAEGFYANLAEVLPDVVQDRIATELIRLIEEDRQAREQRDKQYEEGIRRTGMGNDAPGGADFEGASKVVHPMMTEACIDYESRVIKEIFPTQGPAKAHIVGEVTAEKQEKADRVSQHMNWQFRDQIKEARATFETMLTQVPLGGSQFIRMRYDHRLKRPRLEFASIDRVLVPSNAADFASADRRTYVDRISATELKRRVDMGMYVDVSLPPPSMQPDPTQTEKALNRVEGVEPGAMNLDGDRDIYETTVSLVVTEDMAEALAEANGGEAIEQADELAPYLISIDVTSRKVLAFYRCWEENDPAREALDHLYEFPFLPWTGPYGIGFPQVIGGLSGAATGAMRALLDSALANNVPGGLILKGSGTSGASPETSIGTWAEIEGGLETDDIRKRVMPYPVNPTSPVLFQLLGFTVEAAKGVVRTSMDTTPINESSAAVPVGTQMSRVEEGLVVFSAVFARAHEAMNRLLKGLYRLNRLYMPEQLKVDALGKEVLVKRSDYLGPCTVQPTSDPSIYSDQQRFMQLNYIQGRAAMFPQLYKLRELELRGLKLMKIPDAEALLVAAPEPHELNPVNENLAMALGQPVVVFPDQDHLAHLQVLLDFLQSPVLGMNPLIAPKYLPMALNHAAEHISYYYVQHTIETVEQAAGESPTRLMSKDPKIKAMFDGLLAAASQKVVPAMAQVMQQIMPVIQSGMAMMKQLMPPPIMDPAQAALAAAKQETERKAAADAAGHQIDAGRLQLDAAKVKGGDAKTEGDLAVKEQANQIKQQQVGLEAERNQIEREGQQLDAATKIATTTIDSKTAMDISEMRMTEGKSSRFTNGNSLSKP